MATGNDGLNLAVFGDGGGFEALLGVREDRDVRRFARLWDAGRDGLAVVSGAGEGDLRGGDNCLA